MRRRGNRIGIYELNKLMRPVGSVYKAAVEDKEFKKRWDVEKGLRISKQKGCAYCGRKLKFARAVLHHKKMFEIENKIRMERAEIGIKIILGEMDYGEGCARHLKLMKELMDYYKTLEDTDLICSGCHAKEHGLVVNKQRKLF